MMVINGLLLLNHNLWTLHDAHLASEIVAFYMVKALPHVLPLLYVDSSACLCVLGYQCKFFRSTEAASQWIAALLGISIGLRV